MTVGHELLADADAVQARVRALGAEISEAFPGGVVLVGVLKGSVPFLADLARAITVPVQIDFVAVSSYRPEGGRVRLVKDIQLDITGQAVVLVHDVVHTGLTTAYLVGELGRRGAASVDVYALVDRSAQRVVPITLRGSAFHVEQGFVVGMGLDHEGRYRNLDVLVVVDEELLAADADALVGDLYGGAREALGGGRASTPWR